MLLEPSASSASEMVSSRLGTTAAIPKSTPACFVKFKGIVSNWNNSLLGYF